MGIPAKKSAGGGRLLAMGALFLLAFVAARLMPILYFLGLSLARLKYR